MNRPKRHHFVPSFYLKGFTDTDELIWVYDRKDKVYRKLKTEDVAVQKHYYTFTEKGGEKNYEIEEYFSKVESLAKPIIDKISKKLPIDKSDKANLSMYVALQKTRVPLYQNENDEMITKVFKKLSEHLVTQDKAQSLIEERFENNGISVEDVETFVKEGDYEIVVPREHSLFQSLGIATDIADYFFNMKWRFLHNIKKASFITSDNPFMLVPPDVDEEPNFWNRGVGILTRGALKIMPLSSSTLLVMGERGESILGGEIDRVQCRKINILLARNSYRFIYSNNIDLLKSIVKKSKVDLIPYERERIIMS